MVSSDKQNWKQLEIFQWPENAQENLPVHAVSQAGRDEKVVKYRSGILHALRFYYI